jgi:hypothetical protein
VDSSVHIEMTNPMYQHVHSGQMRQPNLLTDVQTQLIQSAQQPLQQIQQMQQQVLQPLQQIQQMQQQAQQVLQPLQQVQQLIQNQTPNSRSSSRSRK